MSFHKAFPFMKGTSCRESSFAEKSIYKQQPDVNRKERRKSKNRKHGGSSNRKTAKTRKPTVMNDWKTSIMILHGGIQERIVRQNPSHETERRCPNNGKKRYEHL